MIKILFIFLSLAFEILAIISIIYSHGYFDSIYFFIFLNACSAISLAYASYILIPAERYKKNYLTVVIFFFLYFFISIFEFLGFLILYLILKRTHLEKSEIFHIDTEYEIGHKIMSVTGRQYGEGSVVSRLTDAKVPASLQQSSLLYLINKSPALSYKFVKRSLYNPQDEIRLLAFGLLSKIEKDINNKIMELKKYLNDFNDKNNKGEIYLDLAKLYWESVYKNISDNEFDDYNLKKSKQYALESIKENYKKFENFFLLGKISLKLKDIEQAQKYFMESLRFDYFKDKTIPYMAEIYFNEKKYSESKRLFENIKMSTLNNKLKNIVDLWKD
jgi:hypothetical protein